MKKKALIIALVISLLTGLLCFSASALDNSSNIQYETAVSYNFEHTLLGTHKTKGYGYNYASGQFSSYDLTLFGVNEKVTATYQYQFSVNTDGSYYITHRFSSSANIDKYVIRVINVGTGETIYKFNGNNTMAGGTQQNIGITLDDSKEYIFVVNIYAENIPTATPISYRIDYGISYSSTGSGNDLDQNQTTSAQSYYTLEKIDTQGKYWYRYNGYKYDQRAASIDSFSDVSNVAQITFESIENSGYSTSGNPILYSIDLRVPLPKTGAYTAYWVIGNIENVETNNPSVKREFPTYINSAYGGSATQTFNHQTTSVYPRTVQVPSFSTSGIEGQALPNSVPYTSIYMQFQPKTGTSTRIQNLRFYLVCEPVFPDAVFGGYAQNYIIDGTEIGVNDIVQISGGTATITLPVDGENVVYTSTNYYYDSELHQFHFTATDGTEGIITYTGTGIIFQLTPPGGPTTDYFANFEGVGNEGTDGTGIQNDNPDPEPDADTDSDNVKGPSFLQRIWNAIKDALGTVFEAIINGIADALSSLFQTILGLILQVLNSITGIINGLLDGAGDAIGNFFGLFSGENSVMNDINEDVIENEDMNVTGAMGVIGAFVTVIPAPIMTILTFFFVISALMLLIYIIGKRD